SSAASSTQPWPALLHGMIRMCLPDGGVNDSVGASILVTGPMASVTTADARLGPSPGLLLSVDPPEPAAKISVEAIATTVKGNVPGRRRRRLPALVGLIFIATSSILPRLKKHHCSYAEISDRGESPLVQPMF